MFEKLKAGDMSPHPVLKLVKEQAPNVAIELWCQPREAGADEPRWIPFEVRALYVHKGELVTGKADAPLLQSSVWPDMLPVYVEEALAALWLQLKDEPPDGLLNYPYSALLAVKGFRTRPKAEWWPMPEATP
jgi:hypothetical protein